ncbi:MAG: hypothetical protein LBS60_05740 [Deltaproteobacteria bacterium]|nr:hypothetical protein [Deltaproteobacteria bacterium]
MYLKIFSQTRSKIVWTLSFLVAVSLLSGCAGQKLGKQTVVVKHYPECYRPIDDLRQAAKKVNQATAAGAILGAITGAAAGYMESGNRTGAIKGAVAGGLAGAGLGYLISSEVQAMNQAERFRTYLQVMDQDVGNMKQAVAAAKIANACYNKQYKTLAKNYKAGKIPQEEMNERLNEIKNGSNDAYTILRNYSDNSMTASQTYDQVINMERERPDKPSPAYIRQITQKKSAHAVQVKTANTTADQIMANMQRYDDVSRINTY